MKISLMVFVPIILLAGLVSLIWLARVQIIQWGLNSVLHQSAIDDISVQVVRAEFGAAGAHDFPVLFEAVIVHGQTTVHVDGFVALDGASADHVVADVNARSDSMQIGELAAKSVALKLMLAMPAVSPIDRLDVLEGSSLNIGSLDFGGSSLPDLSIQFAGKANYEGEGWRYQGGISAKKLIVQLGSSTLPLQQLVAQVIVDERELALKGNLGHAQLPGKFEFGLAHEFSKQAGSLVFKTSSPISLDNEGAKLSQAISPWPHQFDLFAGQIGLKAKASWSGDKAISVTSNLSLKDIGGMLADGLLFSGLSTTQELQLAPTLHSLKPGRLDLAHVDVGVVASDISLDFMLRKAAVGKLPAVQISQLDGQILAGHFRSEEILFDLNKDSNAFVIEAQAIDLAAIVQAQGMHDLEVVGRVNGKIPVEISGQGVVIRDGLLDSGGQEGSIKYQPKLDAASIAQSPLTGMALDALKDFRYSQLAAMVNYAPEGTLALKLELKGLSPALDSKRPVHLNINMEQNLPQLLKSIRFADGVSEIIDGKVRRQYEKSTK